MMKIVLAMQVLLLGLQLITVQSPAPPPPQAVTDSIWAQVDSVTASFLMEWRGAWAATQHRRPVLIGHEATLRVAALHCHWVPRSAGGRGDGAARSRAMINPFIITNATPSHASCPLWYPSSERKIEDERRVLDAGLHRELRLSMLQRRTELRHLLEAAAERLPDDVRLSGQRVRFALDAGAFRDAWIIATSCSQARAQCLLLRGLVLYRSGYAAEADSVFLAAAGAMNDEERCAWNDVGVLLEREVRASYEAMSCAERADLEARLWWLADPLYHEPGNERRAEHNARKVNIGLLTHLPHDGRQHFERKKGGEAVVETLVRYGWPSQMFWAGHEVDRGHDSWLEFMGVETAPPYVVREYSRDRLHTLPSPAALAAPFTAAPDQWQLSGPKDDFTWWPIEHFARDRSRIVQLPVGQSGMLRRRAATRFVWAGSLDSTLLARPRRDSISATLVVSRSAWHAGSVTTFPGRIGAPLIIDEPLDRGGALIGIEIPGDSTRPAARTRFGVTVAEPLSALPAGAQALSQPLLFEPPGVPTSIHADDAVARMYPSTTFRRQSRIGVYWEGYGFTATDTIDVELRVVRESRPGFIARAASAVGLARSAATSVAVRWRDEAGSARSIQVREGVTPVQMRNVVVDISQLAGGSYRLTIAMTSMRQDTVTSERTFEIR